MLVLCSTPHIARKVRNSSSSYRYSVYYMHHMKKISSIILIGIACIVPFLAHAQSFDAPFTAAASPLVQQSGTPEVKPTITPYLDLEKLRSEPLSVRKAIVGEKLSDAQKRLTAISTRIQLALGRLEEKEIDTGESRLLLTVANLSLDAARAEIEQYTKIVVAEDITEKSPLYATTSLQLKESVQKTETHLKAARDSLMQSLISLKASLVIPEEKVQ
jgi:hypothetical protein